MIILFNSYFYTTKIIIQFYCIILQKLVAIKYNICLYSLYKIYKINNNIGTDAMIGTKI